MARLNDTEAIARRPLSKGYSQKHEWDAPSNIRPDQSMAARGAFRKETGVGQECLYEGVREADSKK